MSTDLSNGKDELLRKLEAEARDRLSESEQGRRRLGYQSRFGVCQCDAWPIFGLHHVMELEAPLAPRRLPGEPQIAQHVIGGLFPELRLHAVGAGKLLGVLHFKAAVDLVVFSLIGLGQDGASDQRQRQPGQRAAAVRPQPRRSHAGRR